MRQRLLELIVEKALKVSDFPIYHLSGGQYSRYYLDIKKVTFDPEGQFLIWRLLDEKLPMLEIDAIGGIALGGVPIACIMSHSSYFSGHPVKAFVIRNKPKAHGMESILDGAFRPGDSIIIVDDVATTGTSLRYAERVTKEAGLRVIDTFVLVDRANRQFNSLFTLEEVLDAKTQC